MEDHVKRKLGCKECEEPLRGVHVGLQTHIHKVVVQIRKIFLFKTHQETRLKRERRGEHIHVQTHLHESFQLEELAVQIFKVLFEKVPEAVIKHDLHQHAEGLFLRHLKERRAKNPKLIHCFCHITQIRNLRLIQLAN